MLYTVLYVNYISIKLGEKEWKRVGTWPTSSGLGPTISRLGRQAVSSQRV